MENEAPGEEPLRHDAKEGAHKNLTGQAKCPGCVKTRAIGAPITCAVIPARIWRNGAAKFENRALPSI
jgi:hypothetical protein